ncbi:MAG: bifunctional diguanylate cyclase/phosphodiesterase [Cellvibrionaceae bacterium]
MLGIFRRSISTQLILIIAGASIVAALTSTAGHYIYTAKIIEDSIEQQMKSSLRLATEHLEKNYSEELRYDLNLLNLSTEINNLLGSRINDYLIHQLNVEKLFLSFSKNREGLYKSIRLVDSTGSELAIITNNKRVRKHSTVIAADETESSVSIRDLFLRLKNREPGTIFFGDPVFEETENYFFVGIAKEDPDIGGFGGAVIITFTLDQHIEYLNNFKVFGNSIVWLFTHDGRTIYSINEASAIDPYPYLYEGEEKPEELSIYASEQLNRDSIQYIIKTAVALSPEAKRERLKNLISITLLILSTIIFIGFFIAFFISKRIVSPIDQLTRLSQKVAKGDLSVKMPVHGSDELADLSEAFNVMTHTLEEQREKLESMANNDVLTQLPNRRHFEKSLNSFIKSCQRTETSIALLYIDLDQFKDTNDTFGHPIGDKLIQYVAGRLTKTVRETDLVARLGGDEFAIILNPHKTKSGTENVAKKILAELSKPFDIESNQIFSGGSIGIGIFPEHGTDPTTLVKNTDVAMYKAKSSGRNCYQFYSKSLTQETNDRVILGTQIRNAIQKDEFLLYYQPKIDFSSKKTVGAEALLRWNKNNEICLPQKIINIAESSGFIENIDTWVINSALAQVQLWKKSNIPLVPISINISGKLLEDEKIVKILRSALKKYSVDPNLIEIEITENHLISNHEQTKKALKIIHNLGVRVAIDDFGTGYSSLSYLKDLLADTLKIDRKFVVNAMKNSADKKIAAAIVNLARSLNMHVVVEGIEDKEQEKFFEGLGAHSAQGYLYAKPMNREAFSYYLIEEKNNQPR